MIVLITGAAGFLGSHLVDRLLADGDRVIGIDNLTTGSRENLAHLEGNAGFSFVQADVSLSWTWKDRFESPHLIMHFASPASPVAYGREPLATMTVNAFGIVHAAELAAATGARLIFASTSEAYGQPLEHPQRETYWGNVNPVGPRSVYDEAKRFSEALTMAYHRYHQVDTRIVRIFNTYGPRLQSRDGRVISNLMTQALRGEDLTVYGDGTQTRSFCYVSDEVEGILRLARSNEHWPVNIGNPEEWTILDCAREVLAVTGSSSKIRFEPLPVDDPIQRRPDITRARRLLGWEPKIDLKAGLQLSLDYFRQCVERGEQARPAHTVAPPAGAPRPAAEARSGNQRTPIS